MKDRGDHVTQAATFQIEAFQLLAVGPHGFQGVLQGGVFLKLVCDGLDALTVGGDQVDGFFFLGSLRPDVAGRHGELVVATADQQLQGFPSSLTADDPVLAVRAGIVHDGQVFQQAGRKDHARQFFDLDDRVEVALVPVHLRDREVFGSEFAGRADRLRALAGRVQIVQNRTSCCHYFSTSTISAARAAYCFATLQRGL